MVGAVFGAVAQVLFAWMDGEQEGELVETVDQALAVLEHGLNL